MDSLQRFPPVRLPGGVLPRQAAPVVFFNLHPTKYAKNSNMSRSIRVFRYNSLSSPMMLSKYNVLTTSTSRSGEDRPYFTRATAYNNSYGASVLTSVTSTLQYSATRTSSHDTSAYLPVFGAGNARPGPAPYGHARAPRGAPPCRATPLAGIKYRSRAVQYVYSPSFVAN